MQIRDLYHQTGFKKLSQGELKSERRDNSQSGINTRPNEIN